MIIDATRFYNETSLLDVRLEYLRDSVDMFYFVESDRTFTGIYKGFFLRKYININWPDLSDRIIIFENSEYLSKDNYFQNSMSHDPLVLEQLDRLVIELHSDRNINTWINDFYQRELIRKLDSHISRDDMVFVSDIDEIINRNLIQNLPEDGINYFDQEYFKFGINFKQAISWQKVYYCKWEKIMRVGVNNLRASYDSSNNEMFLYPHGGWHLTSFGKSEDFVTKLKSWGHQEYNTALGRALAKFRFRRGMDPFGSGEVMTYTEPHVDPQLLKLLKTRFDFDFLRPNLVERTIHYLATYLEKVYRMMST